MLKGKWLNLLNRYIQHDLLFFMHIPKTAGTSFRYGAELYFGKQSLDYDYGSDSLVTTAPIQNYFYNGSQDSWSYLAACRNNGIRMVSGHVNIDKFISLCGVRNTITFLRNPLQRIASEYAHKVRHEGYDGSFRYFYTRPFMKNVMLRFLGSVDVEAVGFIGLSERYNECLEAINKLYGLSVPFREENCAREDQIEMHEISAEDEAELRRINEKDIMLYQYGSEILVERLRMMHRDLPFAHARVNLDSMKGVSGWAWWGDGGDAPVEVDVMVNGVLKDRVCATDLRQNLCYLQPPRRGYVGFKLPMALKDGDEVQCRVALTGQAFPLTPVRAEVT